MKSPPGRLGDDDRVGRDVVGTEKGTTGLAGEGAGVVTRQPAFGPVQVQARCAPVDVSVCEGVVWVISPFWRARASNRVAWPRRIFLGMEKADRRPRGRWSQAVSWAICASAAPADSA